MVRRGAPGGEARVVSAETRIEASATRVWEVLSDFAAIEAWSPVVLRSFSTTEANGGIGAARHCDLFPRGSVEEQIVEWEPGERLAVNVEPAGGPIVELRSEFRIAAAEGQVRVTMRVSFTVGEAASDRIEAVATALQQAADGTVAGLAYYARTGQPVGTDVPSHG